MITDIFDIIDFHLIPINIKVCCIVTYVSFGMNNIYQSNKRLVWGIIYQYIHHKSKKETVNSQSPHPQRRRLAFTNPITDLIEWKRICNLFSTGQTELSKMERSANIVYIDPSQTLVLCFMIIIIRRRLDRRTFIIIRWLQISTSIKWFIRIRLSDTSPFGQS